MGSLYLKKEINDFLIKSSDINWKKVIPTIFKDKKYSFCLNSELIESLDNILDDDSFIFSTIFFTIISLIFFILLLIS